MLDQIISIVRSAGEIVRGAQDIAAHTHLKTSVADLVTDYDVAVEHFLKKELLTLLPDAVFYGEEEQEHTSPNTGWAYVVDPIDGTCNFVRGFRQSAISVALLKDGELRCAVIYDPAKEELFSAEKGKGAFLNGEPIHVSDKPLSEGLFIVGTAIYRREFISPTISLTEQLLRRSCDFRRFGAAALDLAYIACGRAEVFFEYSLSPWDYAAGALLIEEAGGKVTTMEGTPLVFDRRCSVWAANAQSYAILNEVTI